MSDTTTSAQLVNLPCASCRGELAVIEFTVPVAGPKRTVYMCALCLVRVVDNALGTAYVNSLQMGLIARSLGSTATEKKARYRARKRAQKTA